MTQVIGIDLGGRTSHYCVLNEQGAVIEEGAVQSTPADFKGQFRLFSSSLLAIEVGVHSRWASRVLSGCVHEVLVAKPLRLHLIHKSTRKSDPVDAITMARLATVDPQLLGPVQYRSEEDQATLSVLRLRDILVCTRRKLINCARGLVKPKGTRIPSCTSECFANHASRATCARSIHPADSKHHKPDQALRPED